MNSLRTAAPRKILSALFVAACALSVALALVPLAFIMFFVVSQGIQSLNLDFFIHDPRPVGEPGGGMRSAIVGTLMLTGLAAAMAVPIGVVSGIYLSEYRGTRFASAVRFAADTLNGVPSIVIGVFAYGVAVLPFKHFSMLAGGLALGIMMIPLIARTTEELLLLVPNALREGALALGATRAKAVFTVLVPAALPGIISIRQNGRLAVATANAFVPGLANAYESTGARVQSVENMTLEEIFVANVEHSREEVA